MKRALYCIAVLLILIVGAGAFALSRIDAATISEQISAATIEATGKPLLLEEVPEVSFMPLGVRFAAASWGMQDGKAAEQGISVAVDSGTVTVQLAPLFSGRILVDEVILRKPRVIIRPEAPATKTEAAPDASTEAKAAPAALPFELAKLQIIDGSVSMESATGQHLQIQALSASITNLRPNADAAIKLSLHMEMSHDTPGKKTPQRNILQSGTLELKSLLGQKKSELHFTNTELNFTPEKGMLPSTAGPLRLASSGSFNLTNSKLTLGALSLNFAHAELAMSGEGMLQEAQAPSFKGKLALTCAPDKTLQSLAIKPPLANMPQNVHLESPFTFTKATLDVPTLTGAVDKTSINGTLHAALTAVPDVRATLSIGELNLDKYLDSNADNAATSPATAKVSNNDGQKKVVSPPAAATLPTLDVSIKMASLTVNKITIEQFHTRVQGKAGHYTASPLDFSIASGGRVDSTASVDVSALRYTLAGKAEQVNVGGLLRALQGKALLNGMAQLDFTLACAGKNAQAIKSSLSGKGLLVVRDVVLEGVNLLPKDSLAKESSGIPNNFEKLQVPFTITDGIVNSNPFTLHSSSVTAKGQATVRLPQEDINMHANIAMLGITLPVVASGPFSHVSYGLDPQKVFQGVLTAPIKGTGAILQKGGSGAENVGNALKGLFRK